MEGPKTDSQPGVMVQQSGFLIGEVSATNGVVFGGHLVAIFRVIAGSVLENGPLDQLGVPMDAFLINELAGAGTSL